MINNEADDDVCLLLRVISLLDAKIGKCRVDSVFGTLNMVVLSLFILLTEFRYSF